jgi:hypothetical protein
MIDRSSYSAVRTVTLFLALMWASAPTAGQMAGAHQVAGCPATAGAFYPCALEKAKAFNPPRTPDGQPDLQGIWEAPMANSLGNIEGRHAAANDEYQTRPAASLVVDPPGGVIPYQPWARAQARENALHFVDPYAHCLPITAPRIMASPRSRQIAQYPGYLTILNESGGHPFRVVYLDGRPHLPADVKLWRGDSRGRWEGKTLVVETTNLNGQSWFGTGGDFYSDALRITEHFTMVDADTILYTATIDDPKVATQPWTMAFALERNREKGYEQMEEACYESDRDTADLLLTGFKLYTGPRFPK